MILHLLTSRIIAGYVTEQFEQVGPGGNKYCFIGSSIEQKAQFPEGPNMHFILRDSEEYVVLLRELSAYDAIVLHSVNAALSPFVLNAPKEVPVAMVFFGMEVYSTFRRFRSRILMPETRRLLFRSRIFYIDLFKPLYRRLSGTKTNESYIRACLKRIDYFVATQKETYSLLKKEGLTRAEFIQYSYYSIEDTIGEDNKDQRVEGDAILLGNSASSSNNHLDALSLLKKNMSGSRKIYTPLSYGDPWLAGEVAKRGQKYFGAEFEAMMDFLPREAYNQVILKCAFVIMNHLRPQARGNIVTALWMGAKVFLNTENILYREFLDQGIHIYPMSDIEEHKDEAFVRLSDEQLKHNRKILETQYSHERILSMAADLVNQLSS